MPKFRFYNKRSTRRKKLRGRRYRMHCYMSLVISTPGNQELFNELCRKLSSKDERINKLFGENPKYRKIWDKYKDSNKNLVHLNNYLYDIALFKRPEYLAVEREISRINRLISLTEDYSRYVLKLILEGRLTYEFRNVSYLGEFNMSPLDGMTEFRMKLKLDGNYVAPTLFYHKDSDSFTYGFIPWSSEDRGYVVSFRRIVRTLDDIFKSKEPKTKEWSRSVCYYWGLNSDEVNENLNKHANPELAYSEDFKLEYPDKEIEDYLDRVLRFLKL